MNARFLAALLVALASAAHAQAPNTDIYLAPLSHIGDSLVVGRAANVTRRDGIYLINLPATSYAFTPNQPTGWVQMSVSESGARLTLRRIGGAQVNGHGNVELSWT